MGSLFSGRSMTCIPSGRGSSYTIMCSRIGLRFAHVLASLPSSVGIGVPSGSFVCDMQWLIG